jgi:hypothetical protein
MEGVRIHILPSSEIQYLDDKGFEYEERQSGGEILLIIRNYQLPAFYIPCRCSLMIKLPAGYPNANPDMFWTNPIIRLTNGSAPIASEVQESYNGESWQRWSRHMNSWRAGIDNIQTKLRAVKTELEKGR